MDASSLQLVATKSLAHQGPIHCLATAASAAMTSTTTNKVWIATGSMDHTLQLHTINDDSSNIDVALHASCTGGHSSAITSVDINGQTQSLASGDWDGNLCLWDFGSTVATANTPAAKKSKTGTSTSSTAASSHQAQAPTLRPKASIRAHTSNISGISWGNHLQTTTHATAGNDAQNLHHLITGSWDHSIKVWDMERQDCLLTLNGSRVVSCLDTSYHSAGIVATGHPDCTVRLWDTRTTTTATTDDAAKPSSLAVFADTTFRPSHKEWITAVQWSRDNPYHLASTSHDGTVKLWDIRSALPLHTYRAFAKKDKGLSLCYGSSSSSKSNSENSNTIYVGGTDCIVKQLQCAR
jgi:ribosome biogenesis protein